MTRNKRLPDDAYTTPGRPCFFTICAANGQSPFASAELAQIVVDCILEQRVKSGCQVDVYCVMPDHVHLIVTPVLEGASSLVFIDRFKGRSSMLLHRAGWEGDVWQPRSYDHVIRRKEALHQIAAYIRANPVRKGLCQEPDDYPWSGIPEPIDFSDPGK